MNLSTWDNELLVPLATMASRLLGQHDVTVFKAPPGTLAPLPDKLGGDAAEWPTLAGAAAKGRTPFFALLAAKAHYLMLPEPIIVTLDVPAVFLTESPLETPGALGETWPHSGDPPLVEIRIPQQTIRLAQAGYSFGRSTQDLTARDSSAYYDVLGTLYHEMMHAWLDLYDTTVSGMSAIIMAYKDAVDTNNERIDNPYQAMIESAAAYVGDRVDRWLTALDALDRLTRTTLSSSSSLQTQLQSIADAYDRPRSVYGVVMRQTAPGLYYTAVIDAPPIPDALRDFINTKILDGLPLTKAFNDTPLADIRHALNL